MRQRRRVKPMSDMNVVPYIDVMLVLLIIFMITTPLLTQGVNVNLPQAAAQSITAKTQLPIIVTVNQQGQYSINQGSMANKSISRSQLLLQIKQAMLAQHQSKVYVRGDRLVPYGDVVNAMVLISKAGAHQVGIMTDPNSVKHQG